MKHFTNLKEISVLIVSYNCWYLLESCLKSVYSSKVAFKEIIVIDNASVDNTCDNLKQKYPEVRLIGNNENVGLIKAVNQGSKFCTGRYILLLDADTRLKNNCVETLITFLENHPDVSMVAPKTYYPDGTVQHNAKNFPSFINGIFGRQSFLTGLFPNNRFSRLYLILTDFEGEEPIKVEYVSAACMLFRRELFQKVGKWDEGYQLYWVDADWCKRLQLAGEKIYYIPNAAIIHHEQNFRSKKKSPNRIVQFHTGVFRFYCKFYTWGASDPRRILAALLLSIRFLITLIENSFKKSTSSNEDPFALKKKEKK